MIKELGLIVVLAACGPALAASPSFDCRKAATLSEHAICTSEGLMALDRKIAKGSAQLAHELVKVSPQDNEQADFIKERDSCSGEIACLARVLESRASAVSLLPQPGVTDWREHFVGRYASKTGWAIVRRKLDGSYELIANQSAAKGNWDCDASGPLGPVEAGIAIVEAGEAGNPKPVSLSLRGRFLDIAEDGEKRLAGSYCGANATIDGSFRRVSRLKRY